MNGQVMIIIISYIIVFSIGFYIAREPSYIYFLPSHYKNHQTLVKNVNESAANKSREGSFLIVARKYKTDKVTGHHYDTMYEKYLHKYIGSNISILEIGLGSGMNYGPGASSHF
jgi:hypothetical protein